MNPTIEQRQKLGGLIAQQRDIKNQLNKVENEIAEITIQLIGEPITQNRKDVFESVFSSFNYQQRTSDKMGKFEVTEQKNNDPQKFAEALDILTTYKATIEKRFHPEGYVFAYWEFHGRIYRAKLKE